MDSWVVSYTTMTILSLIGQFSIIYLYIKQKKLKATNSSQDLLLRMAISDIFFCVAQLTIIFPDNRISEGVQIRCDIYSILQQFGTLSLCLNCFCLSYFSYLSFSINEEIISKYSYYSIYPCFIIPLILAIITNSLGDSDAGKYTCLISGLEKGQGAIEFLTTFYIPLIVFMTLSLIYVGKSIYFVRKIMEYNQQNLEIYAAQEILVKMMFYPIIFLISWLGFLVARIKFIATQGRAQMKHEGLLVVLNDSQGFLNAVVFIVNYYRTRLIFSENVSERNMSIYSTDLNEICLEGVN